MHLHRMSTSVLGCGVHCKCAKSGLHGRLAFGGPMVPTIKMPPVHKLASISAGEAVSWRLAFTVLGFGRLTVQAFVLLPAKVSVLPGEDTLEVQ